MAGPPALLRTQAVVSAIDSYRWTWAVYSALCLVAVLCVLPLCQTVERDGWKATMPLSSSARMVIARFAALFGLDSFGGGFLITALLGYWFFRRFGVDEALRGPLFFAVRILNGLSHLGAPPIA